MAPVILASLLINFSAPTATQAAGTGQAVAAFVTHVPGSIDVELTIVPGTTTRADVDLMPGAATRRLNTQQQVFEYPPSQGAAADGAGVRA